tara:strand:+ start:978 stop:1154 length:177 start_codon:yes stop_codon:yes gene_type:complete
MNDKQLENAIHAMESLREANELAAENSPQCADWSMGVAKGLDLAILELRARWLMLKMS